MKDRIGSWFPNAQLEVLTGLTVALALVPEAIAFAFVAKVDPLVGLFAAVIVCLTTSVLGGRPGMISGATGAMAVVMTGLVVQHGVHHLFAAVILAGVFQLAFGVMRWGKFVHLIPLPVTFGFVNGLALVIGTAQLEQFRTATPDGGSQWVQGPTLWTMLGIVAGVMAVMHLLPKLTKAVPAGLVGIAGATLAVWAFGLETRVVGDIARIAGTLPAPALPAVPWGLETLRVVLPYSGILAAIGLIETLMTLNLIDEMTETRSHPNRECVAQGVANVAAGLCGTMGGCAMIGQSMININSGARHRLSGVAAALFLAGFILFGAAVIERIPLAALVGVMFMVVIGTFEWATFRTLRRVPRSDAFVILFVTVVTLVSDLAVAVVLGVVVSALVFAWESAKKIEVEVKDHADGSREYDLHGALFFASTNRFRKLFDPAGDPQEVVIDFADSRVFDHSGIEAVQWVAESYRKHGKSLHLRHLSEDCRKLLHDARDMVEVNIHEDPKYKVADDELD
ncbi:SulP family inorganic anion transporter [Gemmata sp.]|uniref:SulP family inorganic anion transporter n=1 Tax=Gemmata sp. TaxID=1914242 RepID=UPI003F70FA15